MKITLLSILLLGFTLVYGQEKGIPQGTISTQSVNWYSVEEALALSKANPKPFLVDVYTDWCGWCKRMEATTYRDPQVVTYLNQNFYAIKFNAETKDTITYLGKEYVNRGKTHDLAKVFLGRGSSYPTTFFMSDAYTMALNVPGYLKANQLAPFIVYYKEKAYGGSDINAFMKDFADTFEKPIEGGELEFQSFNDLYQGEKSHKKKSILVITSPKSSISTMLVKTILQDSLVAIEVNKRFNVVNLDISSADTLYFGKQQLLPTTTVHQGEHFFLSQLPEIVYPSVVVFDENNNFITVVPQYMGKEFTKAITTFFGDDLYKKEGANFQQYYSQWNKK